MELPESIRGFIAERISRYPNKKALLIPALMECQKLFGQVTPEAAQAVASELDLPFAEVQSVISFYTMLNRRPTGEFLIAMCGTWNCEHGGTAALIEHFTKKYGVEPGEVTKDGKFTLLRVECLADCHNAPSSQFYHRGEDFKAYWVNNLTVELFDQVLDEVAAGGPAALRERLVRIEDKANPPDDRRWIWLVTTNSQYPAWVEQAGGEYIVHDAYGRLGDLKQENPQLFAEIQAALKG
ncbi:NAD(P)H-dependent oxidoreductase subunit E [bacterium]|nr:NAD(P)H-dependent oxidoreductase subunit E [bacterium]